MIQMMKHRARTLFLSRANVMYVFNFGPLCNAQSYYQGRSCESAHTKTKEGSVGKQGTRRDIQGI